jgi:hypothetical protein
MMPKRQTFYLSGCLFSSMPITIRSNIDTLTNRLFSQPHIRLMERR